MPRRSPARWLAPLALVAAALALLVVLTSSSSNQPTQDSAPITAPTGSTPKRRATTSTPAAATGTTGTTPAQKTYTVQAGDILATVSQKTGVSVERLRQLNPGLDANAMTVGQRIKLAP
jgi:LysM repeat protein